MEKLAKPKHEIPREVIGPGAPEEDSSVRLDVERYFAPEFAALEWEAVFARSWLVACRVDHVAKPGDYYVFDIGPESIIVSRGSDNVLRAFFNVCRHRGNQLVRGKKCGNAKSWGCSYHMWEWHNTGKVKNIPDRETFPGLPDDGKLGLVPLKCDTWGGFVYVNMAADAPSLLEYLSPLPEMMDKYRIEDMALVMSQTIEWDCNWKTGVDAFNETYHVAATHPQLLPVIDDFYVRIECFDRHNSFFVPYGIPSPRMPNRDKIPAALAAYMDQRKEILSGTGKTAGSNAVLEACAVDPATFPGGSDEVRLAIQKKKRACQDEFPFLPYKALNDAELTDDRHICMYPNVQFNLFAESLLVFRHRPYPGDPNKSFYDVWYLTHVDNNEKIPIPENQFAKASEGTLEYTLQQDASNVSTVQAGMQSRAAKGGLYLSEQEARVRHFHHVIDRDIADYQRRAGK